MLRENVTKLNRFRVCSSSTNPALFAGLVLVTMFLMINGSLLISGQENVVDHLSRLLINSAGGDSWGPMMQAYRWFDFPHYGMLYEEIFFKQQIKFQYPPSSLLILFATEIAGNDISYNLFNQIGRIFFLMQVAAVATLAFIIAQRTGHGARSGAWSGIAAFACFTFYPAIGSYTLGQIQTWINAWFALACICWVTERRVAAGFLIGAICLVKPQFALFLVWGGLRRQWNFIAGWIAGVLPGLTASILLFGVDNHLDYISILKFIARHGESYYANNSVNGLLNRMLQNGENLLWLEHQFAPYNTVVYVGTMITSSTLLSLALFCRTQKNTGNVLDFLIAALTFTIASPIAWEHHYGILPTAFVVLLLALINLPRTRYRTRLLVLLSIAFLLAANYLPFTNSLASTPANIVQSYLLFAALIVLWMLYRVNSIMLQTGSLEGAGVASN